MFKDNTDKALSVQYFSPDHPKITEGLIVDMSWKAVKFKQQNLMELQSFKIIQDFNKVYTQRCILA